MKIKQVRELVDEELESELQRLRRQLFDLRSQSVTEKLEDPSLATKAQRDIARILTVQKERETAAKAPKGLAAPLEVE
jgi:large subunit ribosomal protein L29